MNLLELFGPISTFILETDGVLADEIMSVTDNGTVTYHLDTKDIYALRTAVSKGYKVWLVTSGKDEWLNALHDTGVNIVNRSDTGMADVLHDIQPGGGYTNILYMGSDVAAYNAMRVCGLPACPTNAVAEIKQIAKYISPTTGGHGCVRDVIEKVLKLNGHWQLPL